MHEMLNFEPMKYFHAVFMNAVKKNLLLTTELLLTLPFSTATVEHFFQC